MFTRRHLSGGLALALLLVSLLPSASALAARNQASGTVVASGLAGPRGLTFGDDGNLYVAESGTGGDQVVTVGEGEEAIEIHYGLTGRVTRITPEGIKTVVARSLPSASSPEGEAGGPAGVVYANGALWATTAGTIGLPSPRANDGSVLRIDLVSGEVRTVANIQNYELANNPAGALWAVPRTPTPTGWRLAATACCTWPTRGVTPCIGWTPTAANLAW